MPEVLSQCNWPRTANISADREWHTPSTLTVGIQPYFGKELGKAASQKSHECNSLGGNLNPYFRYKGVLGVFWFTAKAQKSFCHTNFSYNHQCPPSQPRYVCTMRAQYRANCLKSCATQLWFVTRHITIFHVLLCHWVLHRDFNVTFPWTIVFVLCRKGAFTFLHVAIRFNPRGLPLAAAQMWVTGFWDAGWVAQQMWGLVVSIFRLDGHRMDSCLVENLPYLVSSTLVIRRGLAFDMKGGDVPPTCKLPDVHLMEAAHPWYTS